MLKQTITAPAKVNLNLCITGKRADGYHLLESDVFFTEFGDELVFQPAPIDGFNITGPYAGDLSANVSDNLCCKAVQAFRSSGGKIGAINITLKKHIPVGAGLGGGSADAAATLRYLNHHADTPIDRVCLAEVAAQLGADVPVCLLSTSHHMSGIGETLTALDWPSSDRKSTYIVLANPGISLSTAAVFSALTDDQWSTPAALQTDQPMTATAYVNIGNNLTQTAVNLVPEISNLLTELRQQADVQHVAMSGSGASCFGIFPNKLTCLAAAENMRACGYWAVASKII